MPVGEHEIFDGTEKGIWCEEELLLIVPALTIDLVAAANIGRVTPAEGMDTDAHIEGGCRAGTSDVDTRGH